MGHATANRGHELLYATEVSEVLDFNSYYHDLRFEHKKPRFDQTWCAACGDNIYHQTGDGTWVQHPTLFHDHPQNRLQDTQRPRGIISEHFYYFGENARTGLQQFAALVRDRQGCNCSYPEELIKAVVEWLQASFAPRVHGKPRDLEWVYALPGSPAARLYSLGRKPQANSANIPSYRRYKRCGQ